MTPAPPATAGIEAVGLRRDFGPRRALRGVDLHVEAGEAVALFGPNGAGKTTLIRLLTSSLRPTAGSFRIAGLDPRRQGLEIRRRIGVISHQSFLYEDLTARENLEFFSRLHGVPSPSRRAGELLDEVGLGHRADDRVGALSRGMRQRVSVVRALVHEPSLLFLDEPFTGLDPHAARALCVLLGRLRSQGRTVLLVTHDLAQGLALSDRWLVLSRGAIVERGRSPDTAREEFERIYLERLARTEAPR